MVPRPGHPGNVNSAVHILTLASRGSSRFTRSALLFLFFLHQLWNYTLLYLTEEIMFLFIRTIFM